MSGGDVRFVSKTPGATSEEVRARYAAVATHTHTVRSHQVDFDSMKTRLVSWCRQKGIRAIGLGSPWEPVSAATYGRCETTDRDRYYGGMIDPASVMDEASIRGMIDELNAAAHGDTLFYLDNETPKGRYGHLWYFGFAYLYPAFHDYSQDRPCQYFDDDPAVEMNAVTGAPHRRRSTLEILHEQRRHGALGVWAHPTSWWWNDGEHKKGFVTNIASECVQHLLIDGFLDGFVVVGYDACHRWYQRLWFHLLDTGAIVPGFAETDHALDSNNITKNHKEVLLNLVNVDGDVTTASITAAARRGSVCMTSGPLITLSVDGVAMGGSVETDPARTHRIVIRAYPAPGESGFSRLDLIGSGGEIMHSVERWEGGVIEYEMRGADSHGYLVARGWGEHDDPGEPRQQAIRHMAITNPVYLWPRGFTFSPLTTDVTLTFGSDSPWMGGTCEFLDPQSQSISKNVIRAGEIRQTLPANVQVRLTSTDGSEKSFHPAVENAEVQKLLRYLYAGEFLDDHPGLSPGEVPPEAFRIGEMREALARFARVL